MEATRGVPASDCGGGRLACPSESMKNDAPLREIAGRTGSKIAPAAASGLPDLRPSGPPSAAQRRPIGAVAWVVASKAATPPMGRRRPPTAPGEMLSSSLPGEPGSAIVRNVSRCLMGLPAQWRARHPEDRPFSSDPRRLRLLSQIVGAGASRRDRGRFLAPTSKWASVLLKEAMTPTWKSALQRAGDPGAENQLRECRSLQVMARTSSKSCKAVVALLRCEGWERQRIRRWTSTSLAEA